MSDVLGRTVGMRGRLWWLFFLQMGGAIMCIILGIGPVQSKLSHTIGVIVVFSFFIEVSCNHSVNTIHDPSLRVHLNPVKSVP